MNQAVKLMVDGVNGDLGELATNKLQKKQDTEIVTIHHQLMEELNVLALTEMNQAVKFFLEIVMPATIFGARSAKSIVTVVIVLVAMVHKTGMMPGRQNAVAGAANKGNVEQQ